MGDPINLATVFPHLKHARPQLSFAGMLNRIAQQHGKTTIMQRHPGEGFLVWVTEAETDPLTSLLKAAVSIMVARGLAPNGNGVTLRPVEGGLVVDGAKLFWRVTGPAGDTVAEGYARSEDEAALAMAKYLVPAD